MCFAILPGSCKRSDPELQQNQKQLEAIQKTLDETQAILKKIKADVNNTFEKEALSSELKKADLQAKTAMNALDKVNDRSDALTFELENAKIKVNSLCKSIDDLHRQLNDLNPIHDAPLQAFSAADACQIQQIQRPKNKNSPSAKPAHDPALVKKIQEAESYVQAGNWQAAERLFLEIQAADPNYPGLDALNSRIQNMKTRINK